jgi:hypothetical protein
MSTLCYIQSTAFSFQEEGGEDAFNRVLRDVMEDYAADITLEAEPPSGENAQTYSLSMEVTEVGDSFPERIEKLVKELGPLLSGGFNVTLVTDAMSEDNASNFFGGPSAQVIKEFTDNYLVQKCLDLLNADQRALFASEAEAESLKLAKIHKLADAKEGGHLPTKIVEVRLARLSQVEYTEFVEAPLDITDADLNQLVNKRCQLLKSALISFHVLDIGETEKHLHELGIAICCDIADEIDSEWYDGVVCKKDMSDARFIRELAVKLDGNTNFDLHNRFPLQIKSREHGG